MRSYTKNDAGLGSPIPGQIAHVFYWNWDSSITFTLRDMIYDPFWSAPGSAVSNPYTIDIVANMVWFATGRELPQDPLKVHEYRRLVFDFNIQRSLPWWQASLTSPRSSVPTPRMSIPNSRRLTR